MDYILCSINSYVIVGDAHTQVLYPKVPSHTCFVNIKTSLIEVQQHTIFPGLHSWPTRDRGLIHVLFLILIGHNDSRSQVKLLHDASVKLLGIVYLKYEEIYGKLCMAATGENCIKDDRQKLSVLANDLMLLAVSVIGAASYIINQATSDMVSCLNL